MFFQVFSLRDVSILGMVLMSWIFFFRPNLRTENLLHEVSVCGVLENLENSATLAVNENRSRNEIAAVYLTMAKYCRKFIDNGWYFILSWDKYVGWEKFFCYSSRKNGSTSSWMTNFNFEFQHFTHILSLLTREINKLKKKITCNLK